MFISLVQFFYILKKQFKECYDYAVTNKIVGMIITVKT